MSAFLFGMLGAIVEVDCNDTTGIEGMNEILGILGKIIKIIQILAPVLLIIFAGIDLLKAVVAGKDDEIKDARKMAVKRGVMALAIFLLAWLIRVAFGIFEVDIDAECLDSESITYEIVEEIA